MSAMRQSQRGDEAVRYWRSEVSTAALAFERRWTMAALKRVNPDLAIRLREQCLLFDRACVVGEVEEVSTQGAATCRGHAAAARVMEEANEPDCSYLIGKCPRTGFTIAIGEQKAAAERVREIHGERVVWVTPDELASIMNSIEAFKLIAAIKRLFPGAEIIERYPDEPAQGDDLVDEQAA